MFLSIITCTNNSEKYLTQTLNSLVNQTHKKYELIIVDGYSIDNTLNLVEKYKSKIPCKIYFQKPGGISSAMNFGIKRAQGDYILNLHSDDLLHDNEVLTDVNKFLKQNLNYDWIYGKIQIIDNIDNSIGIFPNRRIYQLASINLLKLYNYIPHQAVFIKRKVFRNLGFFDVKLSSSMDWDLWLRIQYKTRWKFYNRIISNYRIHNLAQSSSSKNKIINYENTKAVRKKYLNLFEYYLSFIIEKFTRNKNYR